MALSAFGAFVGTPSTLQCLTAIDLADHGYGDTGQSLNQLRPAEEFSIFLASHNELRVAVIREGF